MPDHTELQQTLSSLPFFKGQSVRITPIERTEDATSTFSVESDSVRAVLKVYRDVSAETPLTRGRYRAKAETEALTLFGPQHLAPKLIWSGEVSGQPALLISHEPGTHPGTRPMSREDLDLLLNALKTIHTSPANVRLVSSTPRDLNAWWARSHEAYREIHAPDLATFPESAGEVLNSLVHPIAADAQAHKRFWVSAPLALVHGAPATANLAFDAGGLLLLNWESFGLGDPALEVATWAGLIDMWTGAEAAQQFKDAYLEGDHDDLLRTRIDIYGRFWPFGYLLPLLARARTAGYRLPAPEARTLVQCFVRLMRAYEQPEPDVELVRADLDTWLGIGGLGKGSRNGRG